MQSKALRSQVQVLTAERDMLKQQVEKQAARIEGLMRSSADAPKSADQTAAAATTAATSSDDRDTIIAQLRCTYNVLSVSYRVCLCVSLTRPTAEVAHLAKADERNRVLQTEVSTLRERVQNTQALREQVTDLKKKLDRSEQLAQKAAQLQVQTAPIHQTQTPTSSHIH